MRDRSKIRHEISKMQCVFVENCRTRNAVFMLRNIGERAIQMKKDLYICFIDYAKAFDSVKHMERLDIDGKDLRILQSLYWNQRAAVRVKGDLTRFVEIKKEVRQGCVFSPDLFNLYSESVMKDQKQVVLSQKHCGSVYPKIQKSKSQQCS